LRITHRQIATQRLARQRLTSPGLRTPQDVVRWFGAVQAQEYAPARWGLAQRMTGSPADSRLHQAVARGEIVRTHVLRPTWHFVAPSDIRWMLALTGPRVLRTMTAYSRVNGIDATLIARALPIIERALEGRALTRVDLGERLARRGIALKGTALALLTMHAELLGVICSGPYEGRHLTYALLDECAPTSEAGPGLSGRPSRDEMVAELVRRFFQSHGPATTRDFAWWSGLTMADAKRGLEIVRGTPVDAEGLTYWTVGREPAETRPSRLHLLPIYDEYIVAYRDRAAVPHGSERLMPLAAGLTFQHALIANGQIAGTWKIRRSAKGIGVQPIPLRTLTRTEARSLSAAVAACEEFFHE
jgi:hypothetical protein